MALGREFEVGYVSGVDDALELLERFIERVEGVKHPGAPEWVESLWLIHNHVRDSLLGDIEVERSEEDN